MLDDGYLVARERSGYYVSDKALDGATPRQRLRPRVAAATGRGGAPVGARLGNPLHRPPCPPGEISKPLDWQSYAYPFIYGQVDHDLFPIAEWRDCARQALGRRWLGTWTNDTWAMTIPCSSSRSGGALLPRRGIMASERRS